MRTGTADSRSLWTRSGGPIAVKMQLRRDADSPDAATAHRLPTLRPRLFHDRRGVWADPIMGVSPAGDLGAHRTLSTGSGKRDAARRRPTAPRTGRRGVSRS